MWLRFVALIEKTRLALLKLHTVTEAEGFKHTLQTANIGQTRFTKSRHYEADTKGITESNIN